MKIDLKAQKLMLCGVNGSGKTNAGFYLAQRQFKKFVFVTPHLEDIREAPKNALCVPAIKMTPEELEEIMKSVKILASERKIDGVMIDDIDAFISTNADLDKCPTLKDATINHRHWGKRNKEDKFGLGMIFMSRRPQNIPTKLFENCEYYIFYASPTSDNVKRKYNAIHQNLYDMVLTVPYKSYKFVVKKVGEDPKVMKPLPLANNTKPPTKLKGKSENDKARSD